MNKLSIWANYPESKETSVKRIAGYLITSFKWEEGSVEEISEAKEPKDEGASSDAQTDLSPTASFNRTLLPTGIPDTDLGAVVARGVGTMDRLGESVFVSWSDPLFDPAVLKSLAARLVPIVADVILKRIYNGDLWDFEEEQKSAFNFADWCIEHRHLFDQYPNKYVAVDIDREEVVLVEDDGLELARKLRDLEIETGRSYRTFNTRAYVNILGTRDA